MKHPPFPRAYFKSMASARLAAHQSRAPNAERPTPMTPLTALLANGPVVTDGAWATQLQARGLEPGDCPDAWNLSRPEDVEAIARAYVEAGSRVILTNTFGA